MKITSLLFCLLLIVGTSLAQNATNFTSNDCSGTSHDLFTELDAGKVIVLVWVMPCSGCISPATTAYTTVQNFQTSNPNKVYYYLIDDYANTTCSALNTWANNLGINQNAWSSRFVNSAIDMLDYGSTGMPKIVVVGGPNHLVYYNVNNSVSQTALQNAISTALSSTGIQEEVKDLEINLFPNPVSENAYIQLSLSKSTDLQITLVDLQGKQLKEIYSGFMSAGKNELTFSTVEFPSNKYLLQISNGTETIVRPLTISR